MPELPEVTTTVNGLGKVLPGLSITDIWSDYFLRTTSKSKENIKNEKYFRKFKKLIVGEKFKSVERRGKNVLIHLYGGKTILVHMKMTGHFLYGKYRRVKKSWASEEKFLNDPYNKFIHLVFSLSNGKHLAFSDMRKFAKIILFETDKKNENKDLINLGPEPLEGLSFSDFATQLDKRPNGKVKTVLMDQTIVAGIGNIYSDEILWQAGIHPERKISKISEPEKKEIWRAMKKILEKSIEMGGDSMSDYRNISGEKGAFQNYHKAYRQAKKKCLKKGCGGTIIRKVVGGRGAHFCDTHQK